MNFQGWGFRELSIASKILSKLSDTRNTFNLSDFSIEMDINSGEVCAIDSQDNVLVLEGDELVAM